MGRTGGESGFECLSLCITNASLMQLIKFPLMKAVLMITAMLGYSVYIGKFQPGGPVTYGT